jgi:hypothetical protein
MGFAAHCATAWIMLIVAGIAGLKLLATETEG